MSKEYNVDDILSEIKAKKSRQGRPAGPGTGSGAGPRPPARTAPPAEENRPSQREPLLFPGEEKPYQGQAPSPWDGMDAAREEAPAGAAPQKLHPRSDFQIDRKEQFATLPQGERSPRRQPPQWEPAPDRSQRPAGLRQAGESWAQEPAAPQARRPAFQDFDLEGEEPAQPGEDLSRFFGEEERQTFSLPQEDAPIFQTAVPNQGGREGKRLSAFDPQRFQEVSAPREKRRGKKPAPREESREEEFDFDLSGPSGFAPGSAGNTDALGGLGQDDRPEEGLTGLGDYQKYFSSLDSSPELGDDLELDSGLDLGGGRETGPAAGQAPFGLEADPFAPETGGFGAGTPNPNIFATTTFPMQDAAIPGQGGAIPGPEASPGTGHGTGHGTGSGTGSGASHGTGSGTSPGKFKVNLPPELERPSLSGIGGQGGLFPPEEPEEPRGGFFKRRRREEEPVSQLTNADVPIPEDQEEDGDLEDYSSPKDKEAVIRDMRNIKLGLIVRTMLIFIVFLISLYLTLAARNITVGDGLLPLPTFMQPELHPRAYMIVATVVAALGAVICSNTVGGGILSLLKFQADTDSLPALSLLGVMAQGICYIIRPDLFNVQSLDSNLYLFFPVSLLLLLFNLVGKLLVILRIQNNFKLVASDRVKYSVNFLRNKDLVRDLSKGLSMEEYAIAYPEKARFLTGFLDNSYSDDPAERMSRIVSPICLVVGVGLAVLSYLFHRDIVVAVTTFTAVTCICAPVTSTIAANLPLLRLSRRLIPMGAMVAGYSSVESFSHTEAVVMGASEIFRPENVVLHGIKAFDEGKIDSVILDAASVVCASNGMLSAVFGKIIGSNKAMLKKVENITYEDSMGLTAWVDGKRVLIGNRELMMNHGIEVPSNDYEMRYVKDSKNIIYLSNSGELSAMFVISYNPNSAMREELDRLAERGMYLIVETSDPNITAEKVRDAYQFPIEQIKILPARHHSLYLNLTAERERASSKIGYMGSSRTMVKAILGCMAVRTSISQAVMIQLIALVVGYALIALFSLMGNLGLITIGHILLYQALWGAITMLVPNLRKL